MYRTSDGKFINADLNGAANILKKVEVQLGLNLAKACRAFLTVPPRLLIWNTNATKPTGVALAHLVASA
jgi:transposase